MKIRIPSRLVSGDIIAMPQMPDAADAADAVGEWCDGMGNV